MSEERIRKDTRAAKETAAKMMGTTPNTGSIEPSRSRHKAERLEPEVRKEVMGDKHR